MKGKSELKLEYSYTNHHDTYTVKKAREAEERDAKYLAVWNGMSKAAKDNRRLLYGNATWMPYSDRRREL